ncbi:MAG: hypothetical protein Q4D12_05400 [Bacteroidales bacterium]|nr:hypothetical protein [Bacteroidales bacterium]
MKKLIVEILIGLVSYFTIVGCSESFYEANKSQFILEVDSFFYFNEHTSRSLEQDKATISSLIHRLKRQTNLAEKIHKFKHRFGVPYWNELVLVEEGRKTNIFIPVINDKKEEVSTIWIFELENNKFKNKILERDWMSYYPGHTWMFDYFTTFVLSKKPKSKVHFKTNTRMASVECVETFVEIEYQNNIITVPTGTYCWTVYDADESSDSGFENENGDNLPNAGDESGGGSGSNTPDTSSQNGYSNDYPQINNHSSSIQLTEASKEHLGHAVTWRKGNYTIEKGEEKTYFKYTDGNNYVYFQNVNFPYNQIDNNYNENVSMSLPRVIIRNFYSQEIADEMKKFATNPKAHLIVSYSFNLDHSVEMAYIGYDKGDFPELPITFIERWENYINENAKCTFTPNLTLDGANWFRKSDWIYIFNPYHAQHGL